MSEKGVETNGVESLLRQISAQLNQSKGLDKLAPAFVKAWGQCANVVKNSNNPHFGSDYADLAAVLDVVKPAFSANGLAISQIPGPMNGDKITMINLIVHDSGQVLGPVTTELPIGGKMTAQAAGSAHTYARRYAAQAIAGIAPVDDDGQEASAPPPKPEKPKKEKPKKAAKEEVEESDGEIPYAEVRDNLLERIAAAESRAELEALKEEVRNINDEDVSTAYLARSKELRGKK